MAATRFWHHHFAISVPDIDASLAWYERTLGFKLEFRTRIEAIPAAVAFLVNGPMRIELFQPDNWHPLPPERLTPDVDDLTHGNKHACFAVQDVDALHDELKRRGVDIVWKKKVPDGAAMFIRDNSGVLLEFLQMKTEPAVTGSL